MKALVGFQYVRGARASPLDVGLIAAGNGENVFIYPKTTTCPRVRAYLLHYMYLLTRLGWRPDGRIRPEVPSAKKRTRLRPSLVNHPLARIGAS